MKRINFGLILPLTALVASSAASVFGQTARVNRTGEQRRIVAARGKLTGAGPFHQVVVLKTGSGRDATAHLTVETTGPNPRAIWQAEDRFPARDITNIRIADLNGDRVPEIIGLFVRGGSSGAALRVFHWDRGSRAFVELNAGMGDRGILDVDGYRLGGRPGRARIIVNYRDRNPMTASEFEVRGSELIRVGGGAPVTPQGESGIEGRAVISPARPGPTRQGESDTAPYQTTLVVLTSADSHEMARVQTGSDGRFRISLPPGEYTIGPAPDQQFKRFPRGEQQTVRVLPRQFTKVTIGFDSGMR